MGQWLSQEWIDDTKELAAAMPARPGASASIGYVISDGPDGDVAYYWRVSDGVLNDAGLGELPDADVTLTIAYDNARNIAQDKVDANSAFMQGMIKVGGNMMKLLELMPITSSAEYKAIMAKLDEKTSY